MQRLIISFAQSFRWSVLQRARSHLQLNSNYIQDDSTDVHLIWNLQIISLNTQNVIVLEVDFNSVRTVRNYIILRILDSGHEAF